MRTSVVITIAGSAIVMLVILVITLVLTLSEDIGPHTIIDYRHYIIDSINKKNINETLRNLTLYTHPAGSSMDNQISWYIFVSMGMIYRLQKVKRHHYSVFLDTANLKTPNKVILLNASNTAVFESSPVQPPVQSDPPEAQDVIYSFNGFSGLGSVEKASLVYANYGRDKDFQFLEENGINVNSSVVIMRYGKIFRGDKVRFAESLGAAGVILYSDPADVAPLGASATYPSTVYAPGGATQLGSLKLQGDLLTPGYPAVVPAFRLPVSEADMPAIPVQPIGYDDAWHILRHLKGEKAPEHWQGGLNFTYFLGPMLRGDLKVAVRVHNLQSMHNVYNVIGLLEGKEEPDRYVLVGNHYDAWTYGGVDPSSASAVLLELVRVFTRMHAEGWRPRRTLVFCTWAAGQNGLIGSTEFAEQFSEVLKDRAVVYLNLDTVLTGNYSFMPKAVPMLREIITETAKLVPNPNATEVSLNRTSLYDTWVHHYPANATSFSSSYDSLILSSRSSSSSNSSDPLPSFDTLGTGSDYRAFMFNLGIPSMDMKFTESPDEPYLPLHHTAYETFFLTTHLMDKELDYHCAMARMLGLLAYEFSTQPVLPYNVDTYVEFISASWTEFFDTYNDQLDSLGVDTGFLEDAVRGLVIAGRKFTENLNSADLSDALMVRRYNDAMLLVDKALLAPHGLPARPLLNHVLLAPSSLNGYTWDTFPGLRDLLKISEGDSMLANNTTDLQKHVAALTHHLTMASKALTLYPW